MTTPTTSPNHDTNGRPDRIGPLVAERVLDLSTTVSGAFCAKLLGDLGADVVRVEQADLRTPLGPLAPLRPDLETNPEYLYFNTSKRSVVLALDDPADRDRLRSLLGSYDVVIADGPTSQLERRGLGYDTLAGWNDRLILVTISGFGSEGPYSEYLSNHLITCALGGWAVACGTGDREPLQAGGALTQTVSGAYAAVTALAAIEGRARHGRGEHVDLSDWEAALTCAMGPTSNYEFRDVVETRHSSYMTGPSFNIRCKDGFVGANVLTEPQWQTMCVFMGREDMAVDPRFDDFFGRLGHIDEIRGALEAAFSDRPAEEVFNEAQNWRIPFGLVVSPAQALELEVHRARDYFVTHEHPHVGTLRTPRMPFVMSASPHAPRPAPLVGQHSDEVLASLPEPTDAPATDAPGTLPLAGLRILDLTMFMSGPLATLLAGDYGADVIKVESVQRLDGWRGVGRGGSRPWENSGLFNWINRNKRGITLNLADERGAELLRRLVEGADVVIENYTPRVMPNFGLDYESLKKINPNIIMVSMPGFGGTGPARDFAAFAWTTEQMSGITHLTGYADSDPIFTGTTCGDPLAGLMGAVALLAAVNHRRRTGEGQHVDLSQVEASTAFVGEYIVEAQLSGSDPGRRGNEDRWMAPHGIYPCGDDRWIALACPDDDAWHRLCGLMGVLDGDGGAPHPTLAERRGAAAEVERLITAWSDGKDPSELMHELQAHGIAAAAVMNGPELLVERHLRARDFFIPIDRDEIGVKHHLAEPFKLRHGSLAPVRRTAYLGEHNRDILGGELGLSDAELAQLEADQVIGDWPAGVPRSSVAS